MKRFGFKFIGFLIMAVSSVFFSCATMQEDVYIDMINNSSEVAEFEKRFSELDARFFDGSDIAGDKELSKKSSDLISDIEKSLSDVSLKKSVVARLYAIAGCTAFDMGNRSLAKKYYDSSVDSFKGDARSLVLASRLGIEKNFSEKIKLYSDKSILILEEALNRYSKSEYSSSAAKFDEAFLSLDSFYRSSYGDIRNSSWNLKNLSSDPSSRENKLLAKAKLTVMDMILLANRNPELLFNYTAGKELSEKELYAKVSGGGLLNPASQPISVENTVTKNSSVTRLIAARFLWNLYNHRRNSMQDLTKYSEKYKNKKRSPVVDVKLDSPDFDAVLGCVENEIMHLEDGIEFGSEKEVSGVEFDESIKKIR